MARTVESRLAEMIGSLIVQLAQSQSQVEGLNEALQQAQTQIALIQGPTLVPNKDG